MLALVLVAVIVRRGLKGGFEGVLKVVLPALAVILVVLALRAVTLPGASEGLGHLFAVDVSEFGDARVWLEAFSQVLFSTGAGFGLYLTYSVYSTRRSRLAADASTVAVSDLLVAVIAAVAVLASLYALGSANVVEGAVIASGEGLAFVYFAQLFADMPGGAFFAVLFFGALALACLSTLIAFVELAARNVMDMGISRPRAVTAVVLVAFIGGVPSAIDTDFLGNQDFVWGIGLLLSGLFVAVAAMKHGLGRIRGAVSDSRRLAVWWVWCIRAVPAIFVVLTGWWMYQAIAVYAPDSWWNPFDTYSLATMLTQWAIALAVVIAFNGFLAGKVTKGPMADAGTSEDLPPAALVDATSTGASGEHEQR
jgi:NSS family neurotransmitter:Na+ symporter